MQQTAHERLFNDVDIVALAVETDDRYSFYPFHQFLFDTTKLRSTFVQPCVRQTRRRETFLLFSRVLSRSLSRFKYVLVC